MPILLQSCGRRAGFYYKDSKSMRTSLLHLLTWRRVIKTGSVSLSDFDSSAGYEPPLMNAVPDVTREGSGYTGTRVRTVESPTRVL